MESLIGKPIEPLPEELDWSLYSRIVRGKTRRAVLLEIGRSSPFKTEEKTATQIRKNLADDYSVSLNPVISVLKELQESELIHCVGTTTRRTQKIYDLTDKGQYYVNQLKK